MQWPPNPSGLYIGIGHELDEFLDLVGFVTVLKVQATQPVIRFDVLVWTIVDIHRAQALKFTKVGLVDKPTPADLFTEGF